jgi:PEP-CTERM motif
MKIMCLCLAAFATVLLVAPPEAKASTITTSIGNTSSPFINGSSVLPATFTAQQTGLAPFNAFCGSDTGAAGSTNCDASWTFNYAIPVGETVTGGSVKFGINDIDSAALGNQVALFRLNGGDILTASLNVLSEALNGGTGSINREYDEFTLSLTAASLVQLNLATATFHLSLLNPGLGVLPGGTPSNSGALLFSTLTLQSDSIPGGGPTVPEPTTLLLLASGLVAALRSRMQCKTRVNE